MNIIQIAFLVHLSSAQGELLGSLDVRRPASSDVSQQFVNTLEDTFLVQSSSNLLTVLLLTKSRSSPILGHVGSKSRSLGQILKKACEHTRDHMFDPIFLKLAHNVTLDII